MKKNRSKILRGRWTPEEHQRYLDSVKTQTKIHWPSVSLAVKTRTAAQCKSHHQKFTKKLVKTNEKGIQCLLLNDQYGVNCLREQIGLTMEELHEDLGLTNFSFSEL